MTSYCVNSKKYWTEYGRKYSKNWSSLGQKKISRKELNFIKNNLARIPIKNKYVLDIGVGTGRILDSLIKNKTVAKITGIDYSESMINYCKNKYKETKKIDKLIIADISKFDFKLNKQFHFISAIRVLKYNRNWKIIISKLVRLLYKDGIFVFCMPNIYSLNKFSGIKTYRTTIKDLKKIINNDGLKIIDITSFSKLPDFFYRSSNKFIISLILLIEKFLNVFFGKLLFGRLIFISVKRVN